MARSTKTQKALNLNAAHGLLSRGSSVAEAATILARERGISLRQAYRYLQRARVLGRAIPVGEPSVPATFKIPRDVLAQLCRAEAKGTVHCRELSTFFAALRMAT